MKVVYLVVFACFMWTALATDVPSPPTDHLCDYNSVSDCVNVCYCCWDEDNFACKSVFEVASTELETKFSEGSEDVCITHYNEPKCAELHSKTTVVETRNNPWILTTMILETLFIVGSVAYIVWGCVIRKRYSDIV